MSGWMVSEIVAQGGLDLSDPDEEDLGHYRTQYRGYYLWFIQNDNKLNAAWVDDFDRWANSRVYEGPAPTTREELNTLLDHLDAMKNEIERRDMLGRVICRPPSSLDEVDAYTERVRLTGAMD